MSKRTKDPHWAVFHFSEDFITDLQRGSLGAEIYIHDLKPEDPLKGVPMNLTRGCPCDQCWERRKCVVECRAFKSWVSRGAPRRRATVKANCTGL